MDIGEIAPAIEEIELPGGALKLRRRRDAATASRAGGEMPAASAARQAAHIITMAWGDRYIADLLSLTIPALLAPGNLPSFVRHFDCEFVIVTESRQFDLIATSPAILQILRHCDLRLVPVDDLLSPWYGITLTYALVRGFVDLGEAMVGAHLVFLNADFIVADGSYAKLAEAILRGERLIVSPSYCMVQEDTIDWLRARYDAANQAIAIPRRELAAMILAHRHNTVRAKTVNQQLFRIHRYDQFYWYVDEHTLLGRQMPIAVVYMRPERVLTEMPTFWDYGVISEYCPNATPCVLGDSDDFLMAELRTEGTFRELLHLGWPDAAEIAADLSSFTTQDHRDYGRYTLVLHSADLPPGIAEGKAALAAFVDQVYARLSPPISYRNHPFWAAAFPRFLAGQIDERNRREQRARALAAALRDDPRAADRHRRIAELRSRIRDAKGSRIADEAASLGRRRDIDAQLEALDADHHSRRRVLEERQEAAAAAGARPAVTQLAMLESELADLLAEQERQVGTSDGDALGVTEQQDRDGAAALKAAAAPASARLARLYRRCFGQLPRTTRWHPYDTVLRPALSAIEAAGEVAEVLLISSGGPLGPLLVKELPARKLAITPRMAGAGIYDELIGDERKFGLCVMDLAFDDLFVLRAILDRIRPLLTPGSRIVAFHHNSAGRALDDSTYGFTRGAFPLVGRSRIAFAGSRPGSLAARLFERAINRPASRWHLPMLAMALGASAILARLAAQLEARRSPRQVRRHCTSMTIEIELD